MRARNSGVVCLGLLAAACGGGQETATTAWAPARSAAGAEQVAVARPVPEPSGGEIVEVYESRLPTSVPRLDMASAGEATQETPGATAESAASAGAEEATEPVAAAIPSEPTEPIEPTEPTATVAAAEGGIEICPADIESLRVRARNVPGGAAIVLTARGDEDVALLRERMREFALVHSAEQARQRAEASLATPSVPPSATPPRDEIADPASPLLSVRELRLVEISRGVRVELLHGEDARRASVRELRERVREDVSALDEGICPLSFQTT